MRTVDEAKHEHARTLFFQTDKSQGEIAAEVGISDKTLYLWTREGDWRRLRSASKLMPSLIIDNFYAQVQELNDEIRTREPGKRYPSLQEAEIFRKMMLTIDRSKKKATQAEHMELMQKFLEWVAPQNHELLQTLTNYADRFLKSRSTSGFYPFDMEYDEEIETPLPLASLRGTKQSHDSTEEPEEYYTEPTEEPQEAPSLFLGKVPQAEGSPLATDEPHNTSSPEHVTQQAGERPGEASLAQGQSEIIGNYEPPQQPNETQSLNPENTPPTEGESVIINPPEISNNETNWDIYKGLSAGEAYQKYLALKKEKEQNDQPKEAPPEAPPKEETQLFSIGEKVFTMKVKK